METEQEKAERLACIAQADLEYLTQIAMPRQAQWEAERIERAFRHRNEPTRGPEPWRDVCRTAIRTLRRIRRNLLDLMQECKRRDPGSVCW